MRSQDQIRWSATRGDILQETAYVFGTEVKGRKLYEYARQGIAIEIQARPVTIERLEIRRSI